MCKIYKLAILALIQLFGLSACAIEIPAGGNVVSSPTQIATSGTLQYATSVPTQTSSPSVDEDGYFPPGTEFWVAFLDPPEYGRANYRPEGIAVRYLNRTENSGFSGYEHVYHFERLATNEPLTFLIRFGFADRINLVPDMHYQLVAKIVRGWPSAFGLAIKQDDELVFLGITDWQLGGEIPLDALAPITVRQTRVLTNRYSTEYDCANRITNTELEFSLGDEAVRLHQGESANLGDYQINLEIARIADYNDSCVDGGINGISFTVFRREEQ